MQPLDFGTIEMLAREADNKIKALTDFVNQLKTVKDSLDHLRRSQEHRHALEIQGLREDIACIRLQLESLGLPKLDVYSRKFDVIKGKLASSDWPEAIDMSCVPVTEEDKKRRAENILDLLVTEFLQNLNFLDYGCGDGQVALTAASRGSVALGYDIQQKWQENSILTTNFDKVIKNAPYDVVLLYDVLDHLRIEPVEVLTKICGLLSSRGRIYVRCHPWCSRYGTHLYRQINKAYVHLVLDEVELTRLGGYASEYTIKLPKPIEEYRDWFSKSELEICSENIIYNELEQFFVSYDNPVIVEKISQHWAGEEYAEFLKLQFVDYLLEPKESNKAIF